MNIIGALLPFGLPIIIFMSAARLLLVYEKFKLSIMNFLDFSSIAIHILSDLYPLIYLVIPSMCLLLFRQQIATMFRMPCTFYIFIPTFGNTSCGIRYFVLLKQATWSWNRVILIRINSVCGSHFMRRYRFKKQTSFGKHKRYVTFYGSIIFLFLLQNFLEIYC